MSERHKTEGMNDSHHEQICAGSSSFLSAFPAREYRKRTKSRKVICVLHNSPQTTCSKPTCDCTLLSFVTENSYSLSGTYMQEKKKRTEGMRQKMDKYHFSIENAIA